MSPLAAAGTSSKSGFRVVSANPAAGRKPSWGRKAMLRYLAKQMLLAILSLLTNCLRVEPGISVFGGASPFVCGLRIPGPSRDSVLSYCSIGRDSENALATCTRGDNLALHCVAEELPPFGGKWRAGQKPTQQGGKNSSVGASPQATSIDGRHGLTARPP